MLLIESIDHSFTTTKSLVLLMYGGFIVLLILFGWDMLTKYVKADKRTRRDPAYMIFFIIAVAVIGYGFYTCFATINDFYKEDYLSEGYNLLWLVPLLYFLILLMIVPIGYVCLVILFKKKKIYAIIAGILGAISIIYMFVLIIITGNDPTVNVNASSALMLPIIVLFGIFGIIDFFGLVFILVVKLAPQKQVRNQVLLGIMGIVIAGIGGALEITQKRHDNWLFVIGVFIELIGFIIMRHFFLSIPSYDEFAWKSGMNELHVIIAETGISLYFKLFKDVKKGELNGEIKITATIPESESRPNSDLVAGGLVGIKGMLSEISGDKGKLEHIEIGLKSLVFKQGQVALCLLLANENLGVYHSLLEDLVQKIEENHPNLANFTGNLKEIRIAPLVSEVFGLKE